MTKFYSYVALIRSKIKSIDQGRDDLWRISSQAMVSVSDDEVADLSARIEMISARTNKNADEIRLFLKELNSDNKELSKKNKDTACMRIRVIQADALVRKFTSSLGAFEATENSIQEKSRDLLVRRFQIVQPGIPSDEVIRTLADNEAACVNVFAFAGGGTVEELEHKLEHLRAQQRSMQRLEKSILVLNKMFLDMQNMAQAQDDQLNHVATYVERTVEFQKLANLDKAIELQKNIRKVNFNFYHNPDCIFLFLDSMQYLIKIVILQGTPHQWADETEGYWTNQNNYILCSDWSKVKLLFMK